VLTTTNQVFQGFYDGTKYYLFGSSAAYGYGSVFTSTDGTTFTLQAQRTTLVAQHAYYLNGRYFQVGNEGLVSSSDGAGWAFPAGSYNAIAYNGTRYVLAGQVTGSEAYITSSTDFANFTTGLSSIIKPLNGVAFGGGKFVAVGNVDAASFGTVATSADGLSWTTGNSGIADNLRSVAYGAGKFVAVGLNGRIIYSANGTSWTSAESVAGYNYYGLTYINSLFVAVGGSVTAGTGLAKVKYSADGVTWTDASPSPSIVGHFHSVAYGGGKYMLVGRDNTAGSLKFFSVTNNDINVASGYSAAATVSTPEGDAGTLAIGGVSYNNSTFVSFANLKVSPFSAYILTSATGGSWTAVSANTTGRLRGIIPSETGFKTVGTGDTKLGVAAGTALPLHLLGFSGRLENGYRILHWKTSAEINTDYFEVERSKDGGSFGYAGRVNAAGSSVENNYAFTDITAGTGSVYYRLRMVDKDGRFTHSPVLKIVAMAPAAEISIYPNPSNGYFTLSLPQNMPYTMTIFNSKGEKLMQQTGNSSAETVNAGNLQPGTFVVQVKQGSKLYTEKLIKK
jgi:Secretion system C-terminal sorting domain